MDIPGHSAAVRLWHPNTKDNYTQVKWKDLITGIQQGPNPILIWGRGHVCASLGCKRRQVDLRKAVTICSCSRKEDVPAVEHGEFCSDGEQTASSIGLMLLTNLCFILLLGDVIQRNLLYNVTGLD